MARIELQGDFSQVPDLPFGHDWEDEIAVTSNGKRSKSSLVRPAVTLPQKLSHYQLYGLDDLGHFKPVTWLIPQRLAVGESHVLWGKGDSFKSFLALHWAMGLAYAGYIVIYVVAEGASGMVARVGAWRRANGAEDEEAPGMLFLPRNVNLHDKRSVEAWIEAVRLQLGEWFADLPEIRRHPVLVVFDTLARNFVGGDEVSPRDMGMFVDGVERVRRGLGSATLVIHHSDKTGETERGTESLRNSCFAMFHLEKEKAAHEGVFAAKLTCDRMKDFNKPATAHINFHVVETGLFADGVPVTSLVAGPEEGLSAASAFDAHELSAESIRIMSSSELKIIEHFVDNGGVKGEPLSVTELCAAVELSRETVRQACGSLVDLGFLGRSGKTKDRRYWLATDVDL